MCIMKEAAESRSREVQQTIYIQAKTVLNHKSIRWITWALWSFNLIGRVYYALNALNHLSSHHSNFSKYCGFHTGPSNVIALAAFGSVVWRIKSEKFCTILPILWARLNIEQSLLSHVMNLNMLLYVEAIVKMKHGPDDLDNDSAIAMELYDRLNTIEEIEVLARVMLFNLLFK